MRLIQYIIVLFLIINGFYPLFETASVQDIDNCDPIEQKDVDEDSDDDLALGTESHLFKDPKPTELHTGSGESNNEDDNIAPTRPLVAAGKILSELAGKPKLSDKIKRRIHHSKSKSNSDRIS